MKAIVEKSFEGAPDGELYPRPFKKGDEVTGDLARVAVQEKWAREVKEQAAKSATLDLGTQRVPDGKPDVDRKDG